MSAKLVRTQFLSIPSREQVIFGKLKSSHITNISSTFSILSFEQNVIKDVSNLMKGLIDVEVMEFLNQSCCIILNNDLLTATISTPQSCIAEIFSWRNYIIFRKHLQLVFVNSPRRIKYFVSDNFIKVCEFFHNSRLWIF